MIVITNLTDADAFPAAELLEVYRRRWGIEGVFQEITEVFDLKRLIGSTPEATLLQMSLRLVVYNLIRTVCQCEAVANDRPPETLSREMLFRDVRSELTASVGLLTSVDPGQLLVPLGPEALQAWLPQRLRGTWRPKWTNSVRPRLSKPKLKKLRQRKPHDSVFRVLRRPA